MFRPWVAVVLARNAPAGTECFVGRRARNSATLAGQWCFVGKRVDAGDSPALPAPAHGAPGNAPHAATEASIVHAFWQAMVVHAGTWPLRQSDAQARAEGRARRDAARAGLVTRSWSLEAALCHAGLAEADLCRPVLLGGWRAPAYVARPTDVVLVGHLLPEGAAPAVDGHTFEEGRWLSVADARRAWAGGHSDLSPMEAELLADLEAVGLGPGPEPWTPLARAWQARHPGPLGQPRWQAAPRPSALAPSVEALPVRSPTLAPATHTNCYLVGRSRLAIVDPGTPYEDEQPRLLEWLDARVAQGATLESIWLTHHHADHIGAAALVAERYGARVHAHRHTARALGGRVAVDACVEDGEVLSLGDAAATALFTPGHAVGHLCFFEEKSRLLFSGDHVLGLGTSLVVPAPDGDMAAYMQGLERLLALPARWLLPGHGPPAAVGLDRVRDTLRQRRAREQRLFELVEEASAPITLATLLARLYRGIAPAQGGLAALSLRAHVDKAVAEHWLRWTHDAAGQPALERGPAFAGGAPWRGPARTP